MMADTAVQQLVDTNDQILVTQSERQDLVQQLAAKWTLDLSTKVDKLAYEKSRGIKPVYVKMVQNYYQQVQNFYLNRANQQQQQQQTLQSLNNNGQFLNQQINPPQQPSIPMHTQPQLNHIINQPPRFPTASQSLQPRMTNPQTGIINTQSNVLNQVPRLREPQKFNQSPLNTISYTASPTMGLSQNYTSPQQINNPNRNDYLSQPTIVSNRFPNQPQINSRLRPTINLNGNFPQQPSSNNSNDILHQFVVGNPSTNSIVSPSMITSMTNTSSNGDRLLQKILSANNDGTSNTMSLSNRQPTPAVMPQPIRSASAMNSNNNNSVNSLRSSLISQQTSPASSVIIMPTSTQTSNVQIQPSTNVTIQQSPLNNNNNNNNGPFSVNTQAILQPPSSLPMNSSTPLLNNHSSPVNRSLPSSGSGSISSPDEETINLLKYLKENIGKLQSFCQKFTNEGNLDKARHAQAIHQQMVQFINNPTYESLSNAKHIRDMLERASNRPQQSNTLPMNVSIPNPPSQQINDINQFEKALTEYLSRDKKKRLVLSNLFVEPLNDVLNGVPHKKIRLDSDNDNNNNNNNSNRIARQIRSLNQSSLLSDLNNELLLLPANIFSIEYLPVSRVVTSIELDDEYLSRKGMVLRCKLLESSNPLIPPLRLRISTRYPNEQPEILSLTNTMPPKLEFTDGHPYFEQMSTLFISYLFKLPSQHTVTDILNIWRQSVQAAL